LTPPTTRLQQKDTHRLIPSRFPPAGVLDVVTVPGDLDLIFELEGWTNDRITAELGIIRMLPADEWVIGRPHATAIMAAFCHPAPNGGRFNTPDLGAWYAAFDLDTAFAESIHHRTRELEEIGVFETSVQMRQYLSDFDADFHDVRGDDSAFAALHDPESWKVSQPFGADLRRQGSNGIVFRSVRHAGGECLACYRPPLVLNLRPAAHFEYRWQGTPTPVISELPAY
jgi:RES domain-containing protein